MAARLPARSHCFLGPHTTQVQQLLRGILGKPSIVIQIACREYVCDIVCMCHWMHSSAKEQLGWLEQAL